MICVPIYRDGVSTIANQCSHYCFAHPSYSSQFHHSELVYFEKGNAIFSKFIELVTFYRSYGSIDLAYRWLSHSDLKLHLLLCYGVYKRD